MCKQQAHTVVIERSSSGGKMKKKIGMTATPGMGHLIPLTQLALRLITRTPSLHITLFLPTDGSPPSPSTLSLLHSLPPSISPLFLPPVSLSGLPPDSPIESRIILTLTLSLPHLRHSLSCSPPFVALVTDHFGFPVFELAKELGVLCYMFFLTSALGLCFGFHLPELDRIYPCQFKDIPDPVQFCPGAVPVRGSDFVEPVQDRNGEAYKGMLHMVAKFRDVDGIFVNSFPGLEPAALQWLEDDAFRRENNIPPVYAVGPVVKMGIGSEADGSSCTSWLDKQPGGSVLYVSFGSGGSLTHEQVIELAYGLELSGVRFLWVIKTPHAQIANATYFTVDNSDATDPLSYLPPGFLERTRGHGLVVPSWAPQVQVLSHASTGGFLTHCGWNSILESVVYGIPMIAWPLFAEQKFNAVLLGEDLKVGRRVEGKEGGLIGREEIEEYARRLMKGEEGRGMRERMEVLKHRAELALSEGGSSHKSIDKVAQVWMNHTPNALGPST